MSIRSLSAAFALAAVLAAAPAHAQAPPADVSDNVEHVGFVPEPGVISARFKGEHMYVSGVDGLSVYDISDPAAPEQVGALPLPHFENEDVDLGGDVLLISNDPAEGQGMLYVIDISDPTAPSLSGTLPTGTAADEAGLDLFVGFLDELFGLPLPDPLGGGIGHTASCVPDTGCAVAYLAGTSVTHGVDIVDLSDPTAPVYAEPKEFAPVVNAGLATHDVQFDRSGLAWFVGGGGTAAYDISDPLHPELVHQTDESGMSDYADDFGADGSTLNDFIHHNSMRIPWGSLAAPPSGSDPAADSDVVLVTEEDYTRPTCVGAGAFQTWRIGEDGVLRNLDRYDDTTDPELVDETRQSLCSAHYFDEDAGLVAQGWYEQGTRFLDVTDPADIRLVGYFVPTKSLTWGALFAPTDPQREIVYSLDNLRGIDVLRIDRPDPEQPPGPPPADPPPTDPPPADTPPAGDTPAGETPGPAARLSVTLRRRGKLRTGRRIRYRVAVLNSGDGPARDVRVAVRLGKGVRHVRGGKRRGRTVRWRLGTVGVDAAKRRRLVIRVARPGRVRMTARISQGPQPAATASMAEVVAPPPSPAAAAAARLGGICRLLLA